MARSIQQEIKASTARSRYGARYENGRYYVDDQVFDSPDALLRYQRERTKIGKFNRDLSLYDEEAQKYRDELLRSFREATGVGVGLASRGVMATTEQALARRGIDTTRGGLGASLQTSAQTALQSAGLQQNLSFTARLAEVMQQQRESFVRGEFDFFRRIELMGYEAELQKELLRFQQSLQSDLGFRDVFNQVMRLGGAVVGSILFPGVGTAAGAAIGGSVQAEEYGIA